MQRVAWRQLRAAAQEGHGHTRTLNGFFFTVDSLKDAYLRKDVPFGGLDDE